MLFSSLFSVFYYNGFYHFFVFVFRFSLLSYLSFVTLHRFSSLRNITFFCLSSSFLFYYFPIHKFFYSYASRVFQLDYISFSFFDLLCFVFFFFFVYFFFSILLSFDLSFIYFSSFYVFLSLFNYFVLCYLHLFLIFSSLFIFCFFS